MPLYEYLCGSCGHRFERIQKFSDAPVSECPSCGGGPVQKQVSSPAIQFKGSGWYITDYAKTGAGKDTATPAAADSSSAAKPASSDTSSAATSTSSPSTPAAASTAPAKTDAK